ncbi:DUF2878 domain-containing protein [Teredinibacter purpureus]|jgi:Protein of unknown function (DUF2878).|uniref:DUF2878 domain-containing protein n=1 Tax=Teredinibacter purpureus TaxID=2731756 RepID=UPI0005F7D19C|nr:DUF2878 domain-containing protein [Teredinibacter purpureus]
MSNFQAMLLNAVLFQVAWFLLAMGNNIIAIAVTVCFFIVHGFVYIRHKFEWQFIAAIALTGWLIDSVATSIGIIHFSGAWAFANFGPVTVALAPIWLLCIWLCFASTLLYSLAWLYSRPLLAIVVGFVVVPFSYYFGALLSGSVFSLPVIGLLVIEGLMWSIMLPQFLRIAKTVAAVVAEDKLRA